MAIIMATTMDTTEDPDTESAGTLLKLFSNIVVFIFNPVKEKTSLRLITAERFEIVLSSILNNSNQPYRSQ